MSAHCLKWPAGILAGLLLYCSDNPTVAGGGGVETTGGDLVALAGNVEGARARLVPTTYRPGAAFPVSLTATVDKNGRYVFQGVPAGRYNLELWQAKTGTARFRGDIVLSGHAAELGRDTLLPTGRLRLLWDSARAGSLFFLGTTLAPKVSGARELLWDSLPAGTLPPLRFAAVASDSGLVLTDPIPILPSQTTERILFSAWAHSARLRLNTTPAGVDVAGDAVDFPLLVRLDTAVFPFAQAAGDGRDIRFSDAQGKPLPFAIQRWDSARGRAEIWVRMPSVRGNGEDTLHMHWGNPMAGAGQGGVFDTAGGLVALWHLDEAGNTAPGGIADAVGGHAGTASALIDTSRTEAYIASGLRLDGSKQVMVDSAADLAPLAGLTVTAWIKADLWSGGDRVILQAGPDSGQYRLADGNADSLEWEVHLGGSACRVRIPTLSTGEWHLLHAVFDGGQGRVYVDGALRGTAVAQAGAASAGGPLAIGHRPGGLDSDHFQGLIDEVSVSAMARAPAWIKLAFATQRQGSGALVWDRAK